MVDPPARLDHAYPWDPIAGDYHTKDGWIRLHTNAPHHRAAALSVLHCEATREAVAKAVSGWTALELESAIASAKGCAAAMRTHEAWKLHEQGRAVNAEPLVATERKQAAQQFPWHPKRDRPLAGIRVLDLTRVLAGPVGTRFLAGFGADVLRVDPLQSFVAEPPKNGVQFMIKDPRRHASTGGWGFAQLDDGNASTLPRCGFVLPRKAVVALRPNGADRRLITRSRGPPFVGTG